jgi:hypothetical protein
VNVTEVPAQITPEGLATMLFVGAKLPLTTTAVVPAKLAQPATVTVTLYVPAITNVAEGREGSSRVEENVLGPVQL